jgi:GTPase involved in cell partitioning and DNA repair
MDGCPEADRGEVAFIGRSNVGKSSLVNMVSVSCLGVVKYIHYFHSYPCLSDDMAKNVRTNTLVDKSQIISIH